MRAVLVDTRNFKVVISSISKVFPEFIFHCGKNGIKISAITPNHLVIMKGVLHRNFFDSYESKENSEIRLNLDSEIVGKVLSQIKNDCSLLIYTADAWLVFEIQAGTMRSFSISNKEPWELPPKISKYEYKYTGKIDPNAFKQLVYDASVIGDEVKIFCKDNEISFESQSEFGKYNYGDREKQMVNSVATIMLNDLRKLVSLTSIARAVIISVENDLPVQVRFDLDHGNMVFLFSSKNS